MLQVRDLMVFYENALGVNNLSLESRAGEIVGVFGANAAGKSTMLHAVSGALLDIAAVEAMRGGERITQMGTIEFAGEDITRLPPHARARRGLVLCPERRRLFKESTVLENLRIGGHLATSAQAAATREAVLSFFPPLADRAVQRRVAGFLSGGEQQMLAIGRALMAQPRLLLLDEPLLGLSPRMQGALVQAVRRIRNETGTAVLIAEQYARPILPIIDRGYVIENGSLVLQGSRDDLSNNADVQAAYFGVEGAADG